MNLIVNYSDSSSGDESSCDDETSPKRKKTKKNHHLIVPDAIKSMFTEDGGEDHDNTSRHGGRSRQFPHVRGNWPTFIYIPISFDADFNTLVMKLNDKLTSLEGEGYPKMHLLSSDEFHLSLSRTFPIRHHWIDPLTTSLRTQIESSHHPNFVVTFSDVVFYTNDDQSRSFIGLQVQQGHEKLSFIVDKIDKILTQFKLATYYEEIDITTVNIDINLEKSFHMSMFWCLGNILSQQKLIDTIKTYWEGLIMDQNGPCELENLVSHIHCKIGNKLFTFDLHKEH